MEPLPVDAAVGDVRAALASHRAVVVTAAPGAGKTTRIPPALVGDGKVVLLQPRRVAARAIARRIAEERGWTIGEEVGWHIRFERRCGPATLLVVATEGILTGYLLSDPLLSGVRTVVLDEFHERSIHADLGLALARHAWRARDDLRIVVMSATIDASAIAEYLDGCPVIEVHGRQHPLEIEYAPGEPLHDRAWVEARRTNSAVLAFLPGAAEIRRAQDRIDALRVGSGIDVVTLHGSLENDAQDAALRPSGRPRIVLATNIAETTLTVPDVTVVVDSGLQKTARYDAERAIDSLELERVPADSADQRAGRAARLGPGRAVRLWDWRDRLRPHREPDIARVDLAGPVLDLVASGADPRSFEWLTPPGEERIAAALDLLARLGAVERGQLTPLGRVLQRLPLHPRLARILVEARGAREAALACAQIGERHALPPHPRATTCDLVTDERALAAALPHAARVAREIEAAARRLLGEGGAEHVTDEQLRRAVLAGYPDRVARRREPRSPRVLLASGTGAVLGSESGVVEGEYLVALDVQSTAGPEPRIRSACRVEREWLAATDLDVVHTLDARGVVRAEEQERYGALVLEARPTRPDQSAASSILRDALLDGPRDDAAVHLLRRASFAGRVVDFAALVDTAVVGCARLGDVDLAAALPRAIAADLPRLAPERLVVPSGRSVPLVYDEHGGVSASVKLQELFGLAETPRIGPGHVPVRLHLLAPNGRPVQTTMDLRSFWDRTYPEVRRELRGRYPKHPWPEDPWTATPTARTTRASRRD
jgi:ATP-dependent helicase HrpB